MGCFTFPAVSLHSHGDVLGIVRVKNNCRCQIVMGVMAKSSACLMGGRNGLEAQREFTDVRDGRAWRTAGGALRTARITFEVLGQRG